MAKLRGTAQEPIPYGAHVLCRGYDVKLADPTVANGTADSEPFWASRGRSGYKKGEMVMVTPVEGLGGRCLKALADGPIMEPTRIYLPAGKVGEAEYQERLALDFKRAGIAR